MAGMLSLALTLTLAVLVQPSGAAPAGTFKATSEALAGSIAFRVLNRADPPGITGGLSASEASSAPLAKAKGAGTCPQGPGVGEALFNLVCDNSNTETAEVTAPGEQNPAPNPEKCATPPSPNPALIVGLACGNALARIVGDDPYGEGKGRLADVDLDLLGTAVPGRDAIIRLGPTTSQSGITPGFSTGSTVRALATGDGGAIGLSCTGDTLATCTVLIELGASLAEAKWDGTTASASGSVAPVIVKVAGTTVAPIAPGTSLRILAGTALQTDISVAAVNISTNNATDPRSASAVTGITIYALQGLGGSVGTACGTANCDGGILFSVGYTKATVEGTAPAPAPAPAPPPLANTGASGTAMFGALILLGGLLLAGFTLFSRRAYITG